MAGNVADITWARTPAARWFLPMAEQVNYRVRSGDTIQGFYIAAANGTAYGFDNVRDVRAVHRLMNEALAQFHKEPPPIVTIPKQDLEAPFSEAPDPTTSVVRVFTRIKPLPMGASSINKSVGRDHLWILASELKEISAAGEKGGQFDFPKDLTARIVRFHLLDNVRGEPDMWEPEHVRKAAFTAKRIAKAGKVETFTFRGEFSMRYAEGSRGQTGTIDGEFQIDTAKYKILRFRAYSDGEAWGDSKFAPAGPPGKFPLKIAMIEVDDMISRTVPPEAISLKQEYFRPRMPN